MDALNSGGEFAEVVRREKAGEIVVGVDRGFARQFFTDYPLSEIRANNGLSPVLQVSLIRGAFVGGPLFFIASSVYAVILFHWWAAIIIPVGGLIWIAFYSVSSRGGVRITSISIVLVGVAGLFVANVDD